MLTIAIVGLGGISRAHLEAYKTFPDRCRIAALCDIYPEKAEAKAREFDLDCPVYDNHEAMLAAGPYDLVDICTPPYVHASIAINAMNAGCNALVEKPMAASLEECDRMLETSQKTGRLLASIAQNRFRQPIANLKALLDSGLAGKVRSVEVDSFWWRGHSYYDLWWRGTWEKEGGGCTLNHAVHHIDMLGWMMGYPESVTAVLANVGHDNAEVEDLSVSIMKYPGALATVTASVVHHGEAQQLSIQCEHAKISAPLDLYASVSRPNGFPDRDEALEKKMQAFVDALPEVKYEGHVGQIDDLMRALETGCTPAITGEDGRRTIELITAIYKAGALGTTVKLPTSKNDAFYTAEGILKRAPHFYEKAASVENFGDDAIAVGSSTQK